MSASVESPLGALNTSRPAYNGITISQSHRDITDDRYRDLRRPRKVRFYSNGDRYFKGKKVNITPHRYVTFNDLLNDLTGKLPGNVQLPYGVRQIFTPVGGHRVRDIQSLQDGQAYVCAGFESFKPIKYGSEAVEKWTGAGKPHNHDFYDPYAHSYPMHHSQPRYHGAFLPGRPLRHSYPPRRPYVPGTFGTRGGPSSYWGAGQSQPEQATIKPKVVTVVRNGPSPRTNVKILLNRRSVQSYEQMIKDIAEAFGPKWKNNKVRKLFTMKGREVQGIADFFRDDDIFIGVGSESLTTGDVQSILEELYPDSPYSRSLLRDWERARRRNHVYSYKIKDPDRNEDVKKEEAKKDSGLGSDSSNKDESPDGNNNRDEVIYEGKPAEYYKPKKSKKHRYAQEPDSYDRIEKERARAADEERERARRRMRKKLEAERRAIDEERRKRAMVPVKQNNDPFKKMQEERERERQRNEAEMRARALRLEEERLREKLRRQRANSDEPKVIVVVKGDNEPDSGRKSKVSRRPEPDESESDYEVRKTKHSKPKSEPKPAPKPEPKQETKSGRDSTDEYPSSPRRRASPTKDKKNKEKETTKEGTVEKKRKPEKEDSNKENEDQKKDRKKKGRSKTMIYKSKLERQISNPGHCLDKYEPGKVLGDGNFAIVKQCRLKNTGNEYAMKIIDKSKLRGKEHMIENEIEIMKLCNQPNIVKLFEEFETKEEIYLIMELVKGGDLFDAITQSVKFREPESAGMVSDLANALFYLHSRGIVHRDLKPENLLVHRGKDGSISLKLADFGLAMEVKEPIYTVCGTPTYVAPEILAETGYGLEVDMWAVGVITYILLCGFPPFRSPDRNQTELFEFIKAGEYEFLSPYWDKISTSAKDIISKLLVVDKKKRYTAVDTLCHPWVITQGGAQMPPDNLSDHRKNLRHDLETQAKNNRESYTNRHS